MSRHTTRSTVTEKQRDHPSRYEEIPNGICVWRSLSFCLAIRKRDDRTENAPRNIERNESAIQAAPHARHHFTSHRNHRFALVSSFQIAPISHSDPPPARPPKIAPTSEISHTG